MLTEGIEDRTNSSPLADELAAPGGDDAIAPLMMEPPNSAAGGGDDDDDDAIGALVDGDARDEPLGLELAGLHLQDLEFLLQHLSLIRRLGIVEPAGHAIDLLGDLVELSR